MNTTTGRNTRPKAAAARSRRGRRQAIGTVTAFLAATAVIWVALINHLFGLMPTHPVTPSTSGACAGPRATITAPATSGSDPEILVHVNCPPAAGDKYVLISELPNVGSNPHTVYYPQIHLDHPAPGDYPYLLDLSKAKIGTVRQLYLISVDPTQDIELGQNTVIDNGLLSLPDGAAVVSNQVINTRGW